MANSSTSAFVTRSVLPNVSHVITVKLDSGNYPIWLSQIVPLLKSHNLMRFVDGSSPCPPQFLSDDAGNQTDTVNRDFKDWVEKDQLVLSCINASVSHYALGDTAHRYHTARETWQALEKRFASSHQTYISELRSRLHRTTRGFSSITEFLQRVNAITHELTLAGSPVPETEIIEVVINNVGSRFDNVTSKVRGKPITYDELKALLLKSERDNNDVGACFYKGLFAVTLLILFSMLVAWT